MKRSKAILIAVVLLLLILLPPARMLVNYSFISRCLENWGGDGFTTYSGQCTEVYYDSGRIGGKYRAYIKYQSFTGQGWHLVLDNGRGYYIPLSLEQELPLYNTDSMKALESKKVTVMCLPETVIPFCNLIVSLESDGTVYVDEATTHSYLVQSAENLPKLIVRYFVFLSPAILLILVVLCVRLYRARKRAQREVQKQEKIQHLRKEGKLRPKNQQKQKQSTNNKHPQQ